MMEYRKGRPEEKDRLIQFGNFVFGSADKTMDFAALQPKLYGPGVNTSTEHYVAFQDGKLVAMVGAFDIPLVMNGYPVKMRGIGTVSVHPDHRREGHMKQLMTMAVEDMKKDGVQISFLGGQRQRYRYFGYDICGELLRVELTQANLRHDCRNLDTSEITFGELTKPEEIAEALALYEKEPIHRARTAEDFLTVASTCYQKPTAIYQKGEFCGYCTVGEKGEHIGEICLNQGVSILKVLTAHLRANPEFRSVSLHLTPVQTDWIAELEEVCDDFSAETMEMFRIFDFETVLRALMEIKAGYTTLTDGEMVVSIDNGEKLRIAVDNSVPTVEKTDREPHLCLTELEAMRCFFSLTSRYVSHGLPGLVTGWFPLPLAFSHQESV